MTCELGSQKILFLLCLMSKRKIVIYYYLLALEALAYLDIIMYLNIAFFYGCLKYFFV
jgi:hypothetical protein